MADIADGVLHNAVEMHLNRNRITTEWSKYHDNELHVIVTRIVFVFRSLARSRLRNICSHSASTFVDALKKIQFRIY